MMSIGLEDYGLQEEYAMLVRNCISSIDSIFPLLEAFKAEIMATLEFQGIRFFGNVIKNHPFLDTFLVIFIELIDKSS